MQDESKTAPSGGGAMTLTTLLLAMFVYSPSELEFSAKGARAAALYVSNVFFGR